MAILSQYTITGNSLAASSSASGVTAGNLTNNGLNFFGPDSAGFASDPVVDINSASTSKTAAVSSGKYAYFTNTADSGKKLNLSSLDLNAARGGYSSPRGICIRSSVDNYAADLYSADIPTEMQWSGISIDLSGAAYQALSSITFRMWFWCPNGTVSIYMDDVTLNGSVISAGYAHSQAVIC